MSLSEELGRLAALHERGAISDEEFERAKARVLGGAPEVTEPALVAINSLRRSRGDRWLGGVCVSPQTLSGWRPRSQAFQYPIQNLRRTYSKIVRSCRW